MLKAKQALATKQALAIILWAEEGSALEPNLLAARHLAVLQKSFDGKLVALWKLLSQLVGYLVQAAPPIVSASSAERAAVKNQAFRNYLLTFTLPVRLEAGLKIAG